MFAHHFLVFLSPLFPLDSSMSFAFHWKLWFPAGRWFGHSLTSDCVKQCCRVARSLLFQPHMTHLHFVPPSPADIYFNLWDDPVSFLGNKFFHRSSEDASNLQLLFILCLCLSRSNSRCSAFFGQWTVLYSLCRESTHALLCFVFFIWWISFFIFKVCFYWYSIYKGIKTAESSHDASLVHPSSRLGVIKVGLRSHVQPVKT